MFVLTTPILLAGTALVLVWLGASRKLAVGHFVAVAIFAVYLVGVANYVILPLRYDPVLADAVGPIDVTRLIGLKPFFLPGGDTMSSDQLVYNVLLTVPFGFGLPFVIRMRFRSVIAVGVAFSLGIELTQLLADATYLALPTWSVDANDVILNSSGVVIGAVGFLTASFLYRASVGRLGVDLGPLKHFHDTLMPARDTARAGSPAPG
ncbi:MAG: hypothetical protein QOH61_1036 [Chloroflexota bacterium]|jgi:glycopeptide antibiotics resistance protein|nr:hypothetical protein [Chloroflexota bacterium]